ncbi:hypothetical protein D082_22290 [Synechocystis sp. PCC 6714]|nr:hypothetical protein D082_22290 [Synechocystis sp. PCC 6714]
MWLLKDFHLYGAQPELPAIGNHGDRLLNWEGCQKFAHPSFRVFLSQTKIPLDEG